MKTYSYAKKILEISNLKTGYYIGKKLNEKSNVVSQNINLNAKSGEFIALIGPNGCGKSTLMRTICGLQKTLSGQIIIGDIDIDKVNMSELSKLISFMLTEQISAMNMTVFDLVSMGRYPHIGLLGILREEDRQIIEESLKACLLENYTNRFFEKLSDGERQRVLIAKALVQNTPLMLLDEPTSNLDIPNRIEIMKLMHDLSKKTGRSIIMSTHELDLALQWADKIWLMNKTGDIMAGIPEDLVLNNKFSEVFNSDKAIFDIYSGVFKMNRKYIASIYVDAPEPYKFWVYRALERYGFKVTNNKNEAIKIVRRENDWLLTEEGKIYVLDSIEQLLKHLLKENYWKDLNC